MIECLELAPSQVVKKPRIEERLPRMKASRGAVVPDADHVVWTWPHGIPCRSLQSRFQLALGLGGGDGMIVRGLLIAIGLLC